MHVGGGKYKWTSTGETDKNKARDVEIKLLYAVKKLKESKRFDKFVTEAVELMTAQSVEHPGLRLADVWNIYKELPQIKNHTVRTMGSARVIWERFSEWLAENFSKAEFLGDISREVVMQYSKYLQKKEVSGGTNNNIRHTLRGMIRHLLFAAGMKDNPFDIMPTLTAKHESWRAFTDEEIKKILDAASGDWKTAVMLSLYTGLRFKDCAFLRWSNIKDGIIRITPAKTERLSKRVIIPIHAKLAATLAALKKDSEFICPDLAENYSVKKHQYFFGELLVKLEITGKVGFHSLRHTFNTRLEASGIDIGTRQKLTGHADASTNLIYSHALAPLRRAIDALE